MAMMISKFHKLIQSKVVWYILLGFIVVAFTFVGFSGSRQGNKRPAQKAVGELFGEKVMPQEYSQAYQNTYLWYVLTSGSSRSNRGLQSGGRATDSAVVGVSGRGRRV